MAFETKWDTIGNIMTEQEIWLFYKLLYDCIMRALFLLFGQNLYYPIPTRLYLFEYLTE